MGIDIFGIIGGIIGFILSLLPLIILVFVFSRIAKASKGSAKKKSPAWQTQPRQEKNPGLVKSLKGNTAGEYQEEQMSLERSSSGSLLRSEGMSTLAETFMRDDRKNDWLARQMREEAKILRRGDLMDLGASHAANCDAETLRKYHLFAEHGDLFDN